MERTREVSLFQKDNIVMSTSQLCAKRSMRRGRQEDCAPMYFRFPCLILVSILSLTSCTEAFSFIQQQQKQARRRRHGGGAWRLQQRDDGRGATIGFSSGWVGQPNGNEALFVQRPDGGREINNENQNQRQNSSSKRMVSTSASEVATHAPSASDDSPNGATVVNGKEQAGETIRRMPGTADVPWEDLIFEYRKTRSHVRVTYRDGEGWGKPELCTDESINMHIAATSIHYGQACFEGLKAFCHEDQSVHLFRPLENAKRIRRSCRRTLMPEVSDELFMEACELAIRDNMDYVPPYESGGALYVRPFLFGTGPRIGVQPADEYVFIIMVIPVGDYYKGGLTKLSDAVIVRSYDRAAPQGIGHVKVGGNYVADLLPNVRSKRAGYGISLYMDALSQQYVEEFSTSNFVGIDRKTNTYVTPDSKSVLASITNLSLMQLAKDQLKMNVERRPISTEDLAKFDEVMAVGTAVVVTPIGSITDLEVDDDAIEEEDLDNDDGDEYCTEYDPITKQALPLDHNMKVKDVYQYAQDCTDDSIELSKKLYSAVVAIQKGQAPDVYGWNVEVKY